MKTRFVLSLVAASVLLGNGSLYSAEINSTSAAPPAPAAVNAPSQGSAMNAVKLLIARMKAKLETGKQDESDYADIFKDLDALLAKYPKADDDRLNILAAKGKLYLTLDDPVKALGVFQQIKAEFPSLEINGSTDGFLAVLK